MTDNRIPLRPHLHIHLEPEERIRKNNGLKPRHPESRRHFFAIHSLTYDTRIALYEADLAMALRDLHQEQRCQNIDYVEVRISPRRFMAYGISCRTVLNTVHESVALLTYPTIRAVLLVNRDSSAQLRRQFLEEILIGLPAVFVGIDLAGDEIEHPNVNDFAELFAAARNKGLGVTIHAGEFGNDTAIWVALDILGADRIGHALAAGSSKVLRQRMAQDKVLVESSLISNLTLGAIRQLHDHPLPMFLEADIPVSLNCDVPLQLGSTLADEYRLAVDLLGADPADLDIIASKAAQFRFDSQVNNRDNPLIQ